ncbi:exocyst complex component EXO70H1-like [Impatiens glandulifera]|uniref:exocyst complex component EXO70H1-like n=1 Tax=Impatiens glandulifera TaxID=253017 RepID=UPI001FB0BDE0|nr:exocyst complex component EXO70H1-like [Impatiens glandulifera]
MPRKGMRSFCFSPKSSSSFSFSHHPSPGAGDGSTYSIRSSFSESFMDTTITSAETIIEKWNPDTSTFAKVTSLFYENKREAKDFIKSVYDLRKAMHFTVTEDSASERLVRAQTLMAIAMKRLQKEFYQILSINRAHLDPESVSARSSRLSGSTRSSTSDYDQDDDREDEIRIANESETDDASAIAIAMADLKTIAECMIASGYGKECVKIYKIIRKSIVDEGIYKLNVEKFGSNHIHKMDWDILEIRISSWLNAVKVCVNTLFNGERILCDHVFSSSESIRESCFTEITREGANTVFGFAENIAKNIKKSPEKVFAMLDMYTVIAKNWPEIDSIFSFQSTFHIRSQAVNALIKLAETVRIIISEFETSILKDSNKSRVAGAGVHMLTLHVMNYLSIIGDYSSVLADIYADEPPPSKSSLPESYFSLTDPDHESSSSPPPITLRIARLILVLHCKLDGKAKHYKDVSISYLFLANNFQQVIKKVRTSNLKYLLGDDWLSKQDNKVKQFAANYVRLGWRHVIEAIPSDSSAMSPEEVKDCFKRFNSAFEQAILKQSVCVVMDNELRDEIKVAIGQKIVPVYREFYRRNRFVMIRERNFAPLLRFAPEDVGNQLSELFFAGAGAGGDSPAWSIHSRPSLSR